MHFCSQSVMSHPQFRNHSVHGPDFCADFHPSHWCRTQNYIFHKGLHVETTTLLLWLVLQLGMLRVALIRMRYCNNISKLGAQQWMQLLWNCLCVFWKIETIVTRRCTSMNFVTIMILQTSLDDIIRRDFVKFVLVLYWYFWCQLRRKPCLHFKY